MLGVVFYLLYLISSEVIQFLITVLGRIWMFNKIHNGKAKTSHIIFNLREYKYW